MSNEFEEEETEHSWRLPPFRQHNSEEAGKLREYVARIEKIDEEKAELAEMSREIYGEVKAAGFDPKVVRALIAERKKRERDPEKFKFFEDSLDLYRHAVGMV